MSLIDYMKNTSHNNAKEEEAIRNKLLSGGFGLAKTFWLFWFIPSMLLELIAYDSSSRMLGLSVTSLFVDGFMFAAVLNTTASKLWKVIALVVIGSSFLAGLVLLITDLIDIGEKILS